MDFRFTLSHSSGEREITEPDGWKNSKIVLDRHKDFYSLIERYEGSAGDAFIFYGNNNNIDGGVDFIKDVEKTYGFDADIEISVDYTHDDTVLEEIYSGLLDLPGKEGMVDNKVKIPVIRDSFWTKFINRMDIPVDLSSTTDLDGNPVDPVEPITVNLTTQLLRKKYEGYNGDGTAASDTAERWDIPGNQWGIIDMPTETLEEITDKYSYPITDSPTIPFEYFNMEFGGEYTFDIKLVIWSIIAHSHAPAALQAYIKINAATPTLMNRLNTGTTPGVDHRTEFTYLNTITLKAGDNVRIYFENTSGSTITAIMPKRSVYESYIKVTGDTEFAESEAQGYLIHDAFYGVIDRLGLGSDPFYSEFLGSTLTNMRTYGSAGCGSHYALLKGLQVRDYTLTDKPFFTSFKQLWDGTNPLLNLGLGYEEINGSQVIRIEQKDHWFESDVSAYFSNIRDIEDSYDKDHIFKLIKTGFKKWESENISGIDDPQTKHTYATRFVKTGIEIDLESTFVGASLAIETTRRSTKKKSQDHKFDNDIFIITLNDDDVSPDRWEPELDENFNSITGLLNSETRYNSILTPMRSLLRWANVLGGCLQLYTSSSYKFQSGEGNYDMVSDYSCGGGRQCQAIICDSLAENAEIPLGSPSNYNTQFGYLFYPMLYKMKLPMAWDQFQSIRLNPKKAIGVSQTDENHYRFYIKELIYNVTNGQADIIAWPKGRVGGSIFDPTDIFPDIEVVEPPYVPVTGQGPIERSEQDSDDDSTGVITNPSNGDGEGNETFFRILEDGDIRKTEDGHYRILEDGAVLASARYFHEGSANLYFYQDSEIPPANEITFFEENEF